MPRRSAIAIASSATVSGSGGPVLSRREALPSFRTACLNHLYLPFGIDPSMLTGEVINESPSSGQLLGEQLTEGSCRVLHRL